MQENRRDVNSPTALNGPPKRFIIARNAPRGARYVGIGDQHLGIAHVYQRSMEPDPYQFIVARTETLIEGPLCRSHKHWPALRTCRATPLRCQRRISPCSSRLPTATSRP